MAAFTISRTDKTHLIYLLDFILLLISWHILSSLAKQMFRQLHDQATRAKWMKPSPCTFVQELMGEIYRESFPSPSAAEKFGGLQLSKFHSDLTHTDSQLLPYLGFFS